VERFEMKTNTGKGGRCVKPSQGRIYELIRGDHHREGDPLSEFNQVSFDEPLDSTKPEIKAAIETFSRSR